MDYMALYTTITLMCKDLELINCLRVSMLILINHKLVCIFYNANNKVHAVNSLFTKTFFL